MSRWRRDFVGGTRPCGPRTVAKMILNLAISFSEEVWASIFLGILILTQKGEGVRWQTGEKLDAPCRCLGWFLEILLVQKLCSTNTWLPIQHNNSLIDRQRLLRPKTATKTLEGNSSLWRQNCVSAFHWRWGWSASGWLWLVCCAASYSAAKTERLRTARVFPVLTRQYHYQYWILANTIITNTEYL